MEAKVIISVTLLVASIGCAKGQIRMSDLYGEWRTNNTNGLYFKSDTVTFKSGFLGKDICNIIIYRVGEHEFEFVDSFLCAGPGNEKFSNENQRIRISRSKTQQLKVKVGDHVERFAILDYTVVVRDGLPFRTLVLRRM